jgi:hypothetical protein
MVKISKAITPPDEVSFSFPQSGRNGYYISFRRYPAIYALASGRPINAIAAIFVGPWDYGDDSSANVSLKSIEQ